MPGDFDPCAKYRWIDMGWFFVGVVSSNFQHRLQLLESTLHQEIQGRWSDSSWNIVLNNHNSRKIKQGLTVWYLGFLLPGYPPHRQVLFLLFGFSLGSYRPPLKTMDYHGWSPEWLNTFASSDIWSANSYGTVIWMIGSTQWVDGPFFRWKKIENDMMQGIFGWCTQQYPCRIYNLKFQAIFSLQTKKNNLKFQAM